jgi:cytochrome c oxidase subunit II
MIGRVVVLAGIDYQEWLAGGTSPTPAADGQRLFTELDCASCHQAEGRGRGPALHDRYGTSSVLADGSMTKFDEAYVRESILNPTAKIVASYSPVMPSYRGRISEEQILTLIEYIKSLTSPVRETETPGKANPR